MKQPWYLTAGDSPSARSCSLLLLHKMIFYFTPGKEQCCLLPGSRSGWSKNTRLPLPSTVEGDRPSDSETKMQSSIHLSTTPHDCKQVQIQVRSYRAWMTMHCFHFGLGKDNATFLHCYWLSSRSVATVRCAHLKYLYFPAMLYFDYRIYSSSLPLKTCWERDHYLEWGKG